MHHLLTVHCIHKRDHLRPTATGLDQLPAWFLRLGAPVFCRPIARLFNLSLSTSTVPQQWKQASIRPLPKVAAPKQHADFRPISITPVLTRVMERTIVTKFLYPAFLSPPPTLSFGDQFAFRPTGSTTAALIQLFHTITTMLTTCIITSSSSVSTSARRLTPCDTLHYWRSWPSSTCQNTCTTGWPTSSAATPTAHSTWDNSRRCGKSRPA